MSNEVVIRVENLSKRYTIRHANGEKSGDGLRHALQDAIGKPFRRLAQTIGRKAQSLKASKVHLAATAAMENFYALRDVSFEVKRGEILGIIGRNGAGKSTMLKILSRISEPTGGRIGMRGRVASLLEIGTGFHPELTGRENIFLNGAILGMSRAEVKARFESIVAFAEVEKFLDTPVKRYSSGMYVRLAFAVAAHLEPEILIVDEVLAVGDAEFQRKCIGRMSQAAHVGSTIIFVSHDMAAVRKLCSRCLLLVGGKALFTGTTGDAITAYGSQRIRTGRDIKSFITICHPSFAIHSIAVNGSEEHEQTLSSTDRVVEISVRGEITHSLRADLEVWLTDQSDMALGFYSPAHKNGITSVLPSGAFELCRRFSIPRNASKGVYLLRITLTDHNIQGWVDCPRGVCISYEGQPTATGAALDYQSGKGFLQLEEE